MNFGGFIHPWYLLTKPGDGILGSLVKMQHTTEALQIACVYYAFNYLIFGMFTVCLQFYTSYEE